MPQVCVLMHAYVCAKWERDANSLTMWFNFLSIDSEVERKYQNSWSASKTKVQCKY